MRVVSFNVHHGTVGRRGRVDLDALGRVCASFEADVLCLQEVDQGTVRVRGRDTAAVVAEIAGMQHVFGPSRRLLGGRYGNAVLARGRLGAPQLTMLPRVPARRCWQERRTLLEVPVELECGPLWVACTHLAVPLRINGPQLEEVLERVGRRPAPAVLVGDLNRTYGAVAPHGERAGLVAPEHGPTFPASAPRHRIDHVLHSPDLRAVRTEVRSTAMSDHAALLVDLERAPVGAGPPPDAGSPPGATASEPR